MTNTSDKLSGGGGDVAPSPRSPASWEAGRKLKELQVCPSKTVSLQGCTPRFCALVAPNFSDPSASARCSHGGVPRPPNPTACCGRMTPTLWSEGSESLCDHCHQLFGVRRGQSFRTRNSVRV